MERLIDADVMVEYLRKQLCDNCHEQEDWCDICDYAYLIDEMKKVPTVDAVEVVRCKDCKKYIPCQKLPIGTSKWCDMFDRATCEMNYCAWGERKENGKTD